MSFRCNTCRLLHGYFLGIVLQCVLLKFELKDLISSNLVDLSLHELLIVNLNRGGSKIICCCVSEGAGGLHDVPGLEIVPLTLLERLCCVCSLHDFRCILR
jgi:hypothetical protein